jgi:CRP-like cAMP-binding protein
MLLCGTVHYYFGNFQSRWDFDPRQRSGPDVGRVNVTVLEPIRNRILNSLSGEDADLLIPQLKPVEFKVRHVFFNANQPIRSVVFPEAGFASVVATSGPGHSLEVGIIGSEGLIGVPVILGEARSPHQSYAQVAGHGYRIGAERLWTVMKQSWQLADVLLRFACAFLVQVAHSALANGRFTIEARLARWLLMAHDRVERDDVALTHEFLSMMLGVRRAGVTTALHTLESNGVIRATRGHISICDRRGLEKIAGACYGVPENELAHVGLRHPSKG